MKTWEPLLEKQWIEQGIAMDRGSDGRTLGHKRLYCVQYASNADIGKLLVPSSDPHRIHPPSTQ